MRVAARRSSCCLLPSRRSSRTPHNVVAIVSFPPLLLSSRAFCSTMAFVTSFVIVATLALGSRPRRRLARVWAKRSVGECEDEDPHSKVSSHFGSWSPNGLPNFQKEIAEVKTPCIEEFFYIIGKILKCRCLKWACMTHLDIYNTSHGKKKG
jgi:hypothetical protein